MPQTNREKQQSYRERMNARGYSEITEWVPTRNKGNFKLIARAFRADYQAAEEPNAEVKKCPT